MPELARPDVTMHYERSGKGPPLLMIAGFMSDSASWGPLVPLLEPEFDLIRPDNRTCGRTVPWNAPCSMDLWVSDLIALMADLGHDRFHILGHSLGGIIGWALAAQAPERVASLLMVGSSPKPSPRNLQLFNALITIRRSDAPKDTWLRILFPWLFRKEAFADPTAIDAAIAQSLAYPHAQSADAMEHQLHSLFKTNPAPFQTCPPVPCGAILSTDDMLVPYADSIPALQGMPLQTVTGLGHSIHWDDPACIADAARKLCLDNPI